MLLRICCKSCGNMGLNKNFRIFRCVRQNKFKVGRAGARYNKQTWQLR